MSIQIIIVLALTFVTQVLATLAYSVRVVGIRTGKIVIAGSLFNILALVARASMALQAPLLAKHTERLLAGAPVAAGALLGSYRLILAAAAGATLAGIALIPTFQRLFTRAVQAFDLYRSVPRLLLHAFTKTGVHHLRTSVAIPSRENLGDVRTLGRFPPAIALLNVVVQALLTVGGLAALYAGSLDPALRMTTSTLSVLITGGATAALSVFIDPYMSMLTDDVLQGKASAGFFRQAVAVLVGGRFAGTLLAQALLVPAAYLVVWVAGIL